jgi:predicted DNA-binding transcriptional regulator YafY
MRSQHRGRAKETRMARAERLLELIQVLRRHRHPVSGQVLANDLGVSLRTVYRDIQTLIGQGAAIDGEAGVGYVLRPGFVLPPLMFSDEEIEALVLGSRWVAQRTDQPLARAAANAIAKIAAVLPDDLRDSIEGTGLLAGPAPEPDDVSTDLAPIRQAIRAERKLVLHYADKKGERSKAHGLADRARLLRAEPGAGGVVRAAPGLSPFPHRPHHCATPRRQALSAASSRLDEGMARARGHS